MDHIHYLRRGLVILNDIFKEAFSREILLLSIPLVFFLSWELIRPTSKTIEQSRLTLELLVSWIMNVHCWNRLYLDYM